MEDRYLFRGKRIDNGEWAVGQYVNTCYPGNDKETGHFIVVYPNEYHKIYTSTICQCTGLRDKNGKLIFENDIMEAHLDEDYPEDVTRESVLWYGSGWHTKEQGSVDYAQLDDCDSEWYEVIGNTVDNPELLEVQE